MTSPRMEIPSLDAMTAEQRKVYDDIMAGPRGSIQGPFGPWLASPDLADRAQKLGEYTRFRNALPKKLSELAIIVTARHWRAEFEWYAHAQMARDAGLAEDIIAAVKEGKRPAGMTDEEEVVHDVAAILWRDRRIGRPLFDRALALLGRKALTDLVGVIGYYGLVSATLNVFEVPLPEGEPRIFFD